VTDHEDHHYPCVWPDCPRSYDPCTGPAEDGWFRLFSGHLCPDHRDTGHTPQRFEWERGVPTLAMSCECGVRVEDLSPTTRARCVQWWREHVRSTVNQRDEPVILDRLHPDWDGKRVFRAARDKARATLGRDHPISGMLTHAAYDYDTERWFNWRWPITEHVGRIAEMLLSGDLLMPVRADDTTVERVAYAIAREHWSQTHVDGDVWNEREDWSVPCLVYMAQARAGLEALINPTTEENDV
jgi:hypothetical protein